jgi:thiol-disulfide isomerase/thioredoxin
VENLEPNQFDKILSKEMKAVVMFYADWCPFCQKFRPVFESAITKDPKHIKSKNKFRYKLYGAKVNDDDNPLWDKFSINSVPTIIAFDQNKIVARRDAKMGIGLTKSDLDSILEDLRRADQTA